MAICFWFLMAIGYQTWKAKEGILLPLDALHSSLRLDFDIQTNLAEMMALANLDHHGPVQEPPQAYWEVKGRLDASLAEYENLPLTEDERFMVGAVGQLSGRIEEKTEQLYRSHLTSAQATRLLGEIHALHGNIGLLLRVAADGQMERLVSAGADLNRYTLTVAALLVAFGLFVLLALSQFLRAHRYGLWAPLETLRQMVMQVRRGDVDVRGDAPRSVEIGPLIEQFKEMAREVREVRSGLEEKVRERTRQLEETQTQLLEAAKLTAVGRLVAGVAHEVNNPLTSILGFAEVLADNPKLSDKERHYVQTIREEALRVKKVVSNLNAFARQGPQRMHHVDLRTVLDRLVELRHYQLASNKICLHVDMPGAPLWVNGDSDQLTQMLFNILQNAEQAVREFKREGGDIWLASGQRNGSVWVELRDNGAGMTAAARAHAMEPFFTTRPVGEGMGLGLSVAHGIAQQHHGEIQLESISGRGTTLTITLPAAAPASGASGSSPEPAAGDDRRQMFPGDPQALIIDDERGILSLVEQVLTRRGFRCTALNDPLQLESVLGHNFDIVICDLRMPGRSGLEVYHILRQHKPHLAARFILMTGNLADAEEREVRDLLAASRILRKPFSLAQLAAAVAAVMQQ
ncbi:MAG TPA: ATP-binding protein [Candidatus Acidoferrales bacterium]